VPEIRLKLPRRHAGQVKVASEAKRFNVLQCGRRWGKTTFGTDMLIGPALNGYPTAWFAPTYKLLAEVWRVVLSTLTPVIRATNVQEKRIELVTGGVIDFWSLDDSDPARGRKYKRAVVDEAGIVRNLEAGWQEAIRPTLTDFKGDAWFLGTPKGRNFFHRLYAKGESGETEWASWRMPTTTNPHIDPAEVEAAKRDLPPAVFNQEFLGIPADDGGNPFGLTKIHACKSATLPASDPVVFGVDLAKSYDWTVVCGLDDDGRVCVLERWQSDWGQTKRRILDLCSGVPALVDSTGVGDPVVEDLQRAGVAVEGFKFTASSKQQLMEGLAAAIQQEAVQFPDGWLLNELEAFEYEYRPGGIRYSAPEGLHDDGVMALALAWRKRGRGFDMSIFEDGAGVSVHTV
jgi:hypothetical protein